jgi:hypothetical protein
MEKFVLVADPVSFAPRDAPATVIRRYAFDPFKGYESLVIHPQQVELHRSFVFSVLGDSHFSVIDTSLFGFFDSPNKDNWVYFEMPPSRPTVAFHSPQGEYLYYVRQPASVLDPDLGGSPFAEDGPCGCCFYRQVRDQPREFTLLQPSAGGRSQAAAVRCWMNPLVLRLPMVGRELTSGGPDRLFQRLTATDTLLLVEPIFARSTFLRALAWLELTRQIQHRGRPYSLIEGLALGNHEQPIRCLPFLVLDSLGGGFHIEVATATHPAECRWLPPPFPPGTNGEWFAAYWQRQWSGAVAVAAIGIAADEVVAAEEVPQRSLSSVVGRESDVSAAQLAAAGSLPELLRLQPWLAADHEALSFINRLLGVAATLGVSAGSQHVDFLQIRAAQIGNQRFRLSFDTVGFVDWFARQHILPRLPVLLGFPRQPDFHCPIVGSHRAAAGKYAAKLARLKIDLAASLPWAGWEFLCHLLHASHGSPLRTGETIIPYRYGWWSEWYREVFQTSQDARFAFALASTGFQLGQATLGATPLGWRRPTYAQNRHLRL